MMTTVITLAALTLSASGAPFGAAVGGPFGAAQGGQDRDRAEIQNKLRNIRITLDFQDAPLEAVVDYIREISNMNIFVDSKVRDMEVVISLKVSDIALSSVFRLMLEPHECGVTYQDGLLKVMTKEDIHDHNVQLRLFDVRDILYPIQDFPGVDLVLSGEGLGVVGQMMGMQDPVGEMPIEELVRAHTGGTSWDENERTSVSLQNGLLIVKNTPDVFRQITRLLNMLRRSK